jgi:pilus assembly protein CpaF
VETLDMLQALNTGHEGSLVTVHANSADDALFRLETLATMSDLTVPHHALREYINSAIHVIVQTERGPDGGRRVIEVAVVASRRGEPFRLQSAMRFEADPIGPDLQVVGRPRHYELPERITERLMLSSVPVPPAFQSAAHELAPEREAE